MIWYCLYSCEKYIFTNCKKYSHHSPRAQKNKTKNIRKLLKPQKRTKTKNIRKVFQNRIRSNLNVLWSKPKFILRGHTFEKSLVSMHFWIEEMFTHILQSLFFCKSKYWPRYDHFKFSKSPRATHKTWTFLCILAWYNKSTTLVVLCIFTYNKWYSIINVVYCNKRVSGF